MVRDLNTPPSAILPNGQTAAEFAHWYVLREAAKRRADKRNRREKKRQKRPPAKTKAPAKKNQKKKKNSKK